MNRIPRTVRVLAVPAVVLLACAGARASDSKHAVTEYSSQVNAESPAGLPFAVAGTMTEPPTNLAVISMIGREGKAGSQMLASEGAVVATYRVVRIHADRVVFEREGHTFFVRVGAESQDALTPTPTTPHARKGSPPMRVVAPPANIEEIRQQTGAFLERLKANPAFQERVDTMLRRMREREGGAAPPTRP